MKGGAQKKPIISQPVVEAGNTREFILIFLSFIDNISNIFLNPSFFLTNVLVHLITNHCNNYTKEPQKALNQKTYT